MPYQLNVEMHLSGLGLKMQKKGKKDCSVLVQQYKDADVKNLLMLAHYSMPLSAVFLPEGCFSTLMLATLKNGPAVISELYERYQRLHDIFAMEHFYEYEST